MANKVTQNRASELEAIRQRMEQHRMTNILKEFEIPNNPKLYKRKYPTGFKVLDEALQGGITEGLHCIGAISSLGKSTFVMQVVQHMAEQSIPVMVFSLEMKVVDLAAKAVSRQTFIDADMDERLPKTSDMLLNEAVASRFTEQEHRIIKNASIHLQKNYKNILTWECGAEPYSVADIEREVRDYVSAYERPPVVVVDYLQILEAPEKYRTASDKQIADYNLKHLKVIADHYKVPVILISSFNRESYDSEVTFKSFKDSGNIEYSCDTVFGLQLQGVGKTGFDANALKACLIRKLELKILKQRYGRVGQKIAYDYHTRYNYFIEQGIIQNDKPANILK